MPSYLTPGTDNEAIRKIAIEVSRPYYKKVDFWITTILGMVVIGLTLYYGSIQVAPLLDQQTAAERRAYWICKGGPSGSVPSSTGGQIPCAQILEMLKGKFE